MRKETITIYERDLMFVIGGQLFDQAPNRQPRKAEEIMRCVQSNFRNDVRCVNDKEFYTIRIEKDKVYEFMESILMSIPAFHELNLSQIEYEKGTKVDDESRAKFSFVTRYDKYDSESWKSDFVDLDAFIHNVTRKFWIFQDADEDCFLCIHQPKDSESTLGCGDSEECKNCKVRALKNNYECLREPKGEHKFACKYDCYKNYYICCEECKEREKCEHKCDGKSDSCGNAINHVRGNG